MSITDSEAPPNAIVTYPSFSFTAGALEPRVYTSTPLFAYYEAGKDTATNPI
jgi:hypothetical protein